MYAGVEDGDARRRSPRPRPASGRARRSACRRPETGTVLLDADGTLGSLDGKGYFGLVVAKETADRSDLWGTDELELDGKRGDGVYFNYKETPKAGKALELKVGPEDGPFKTVKAPYDDSE